MADAKRSRARRRGRVITGVAIGVVVCLAGGGAAWAALRPDSPSYRLATATKADVTQTASLAGTVASATRADRAFQTSGTVAAVKVKVGDKVKAGQTLATLDTSALDSAVTQAQQAVTTAEQKLNDDLASQTSSAATSTSTSTQTSSSTTDSSSGGLAMGAFMAAAPTQSAASSDDTITADVAKVTAAQNALIDLITGSDGVTAVTSAVQGQLEAVQKTLTDLGASSGPCTTFANLPAGTAQSDADAALASCQAAVTAALGSASATGSGGTSGAASVASTLTALASDLSTLSELQTKITAAEKSLDAAVQQLASDAADAAKSTSSSGSGSGSGTAPSSGSKPSAGSGSQSGSQPSGSQPAGAAPGDTAGRSAGGTASAGGSGSSGGSARSTSGGESSGSGAGSASGGQATQAATAEDITADEASLASAQANLAVAQQNTGLATLTTPIAGTVAAVGISAGSSVSAGSSSEVISVIGDDGWVVDTSATASSIGPLKVGQTASVNVSGVSGAQKAKITSIGFLNTSSDSSTPSYDVTLALTGSISGLLNGASARLTVNVDSATNVLTVPSSAVHLTGANSYSVDVLADGTASRRQVKLGAIGADRVQIASGLSAGDKVILADLSSTVSSDSTETSSRSGLSGLGGAGAGAGAGGQRFGGAGFGGAGPTGAGVGR